MFRNARIKLTAWYLLIIICISVSFSAVIYRMLTFEMDRFARMQKNRIERQLENRTVFPSPPTRPDDQPFLAIDPDLVDETKQRLLLQLVLLNAGIWILSGGLGYILAGKTLRPIAIMLDEQRRFVSDASHELRTPLTALKSSMEVALRNPKLTTKEAKTVLTENVAEVNELQTLTNQLLELARTELPKNHTTYQPLDPAKIVAQVLKRVSPIATPKHIAIANHLETCTIFGNAYGLTDALMILLDNAIKYSPQKSTVTVMMKKQNKDILISVQDTGMGIEKKDLPHIFDRFYRSDTARSKSYVSGYGLGLSIAQKIIEEHNGKIMVQSAVKSGSTFTIVLPLTDSKIA